MSEKKLDMPARRMFIGAVMTFPIAFMMYPRLSSIQYRELTVAEDLQRVFRKNRAMMTVFGGLALVGAFGGYLTRNVKFD